ncbi:MAG TPA: DMT family transporter [Phenylobacterium sp.]|uniref:DMT family transporter n=1 Tax=Phenylobacterium sp. TaxID=1871053 RepID=UPI002C6CC1BE|nr:DMT family transporter [Phenylobacterium sp.]HSV03533.1 DMT family transporter [Phenylobacterium sp.]
MAPLVIALVLGSAVLHASWNAMLRSGADRLWSMSVMCAICALVALPVTWIVPPPLPASWPYLAGSAAVQVLYALFLVRAYRTGLLAHVYPIARGTAPLLVTLGAAVVAGEQLAPLSLMGVVLVSAGIMAIAFGRGRPDAGSLLAAVATGVFIAGYMVIDGLGVRLSAHPIGYAALQDVVAGAPMPFVYIAIRREWPAIKPSRELAKAAGGAVISVLAYGVVIWAMSRSAMGQVSALRETSILFAALIGALFLKERLTLRRLLGAAMIAGGAVALSVG